MAAVCRHNRVLFLSTPVCTIPETNRKVDRFKKNESMVNKVNQKLKKIPSILFLVRLCPKYYTGHNLGQKLTYCSHEIRVKWAFCVLSVNHIVRKYVPHVCKSSMRSSSSCASEGMMGSFLVHKGCPFQCLRQHGSSALGRPQEACRGSRSLQRRA